MEKKRKHIMLITGVLSLLIIFFSLSLYLKSNHALKAIEAGINRALPGSISIGALDFSLLKGAVQLKEITLADPAGKEIAGLDEFYCRISLKALLRKEILIETASLSGPWADIIMDEAGSINLAQVFPDPEAGKSQTGTGAPPLNIIIDTFSLKNGRVICRIPDRKFECRIPELDLEIFGVNLKTLSGNLKFKAGGGSLKADGSAADLEKIELDCISVRGSLTRILLTALSTGVEARVKGSVNHLIDVQTLKLQPSPELNLQADLELALASLEKITGMGGDNDHKKSLSGELKLRSRIFGQAQSPAAEVQIDGKDLSLNGSSLERVAVRGMLAPSGKFDFSEILVQNGPSSVTGRGELDLFKGSLEKINSDLPLNFKFFIKALEPGNILGDESISGVVNGSLDISGDLIRPRAVLEIHGEDLGYDGFSAGDADLLAEFTEGSLLLRQAELRRKDSYIRAGGSISVLNGKTGKPLDSPILDMNVQGRLLPGEYINGMGGKASIEGDLHGTVITPRGDLKIRGEAIAYEDLMIKEINLSARVAGKTVFLDELTAFITDKEQIRAAGNLCFANSTYGIDLESTPISLAHVDKYLGDDPIRGNLSLQVHGRGSLSSPLVQGKISLADLIVNSRKADNLEIDLRLEDRMLKIWGDPGFKVNGSYSIDTGLFSAAVDFDNTDLTPYFKLAGLPKLSGSISGNIRASGSSETPEAADARISVSGIRILSDQREVLSSDGLTLGLKDGNFNIPESELTLIEKSTVKIKGSGNIKGDVKLAARGGLPLNALAVLSEQVENPVGDIYFSADLAGSLSSPEITASMELEKIGLSVPMLEGRIHDLSGRINLTGDRATLLDLEGKLDDGTFSADGGCSLENFKPVEMKLNMKTVQLPVRIPDTLDLVLNSSLSISGTGKDAIISGTINLMEGLFYKDFDIKLVDLARKKRKLTPLPQPGTVHPLAENTRLNIRIKTRDPLTIDNNMAQMTVSSSILIYGTAKRPLLQGQARTDQGVISFQGTEFEVKKGIVDFVNPYKIDPYIDIESQAEIGKWSITLNIEGTADNLEFELRSSPPEDNADILSIIAFGKKLDQQSGYTSSATRKIATEIVGDRLSQDLKDATGLDTVNFEMEDGEGDDHDQVSITIGKELSRRISVGYGVDIKSGKTVQRFTTGYKLLEPLKINAYQDTEGDFGAEIQFRHEFR